MAVKTKTRTKSGRQQIERFVELLKLKIVKLKWTPIGRGGEMEGPSGGWEIDVADKVGDGTADAYGYNADELCENLLTSVRLMDMDRYRRDCYVSGVANAAKEKDATIRQLREELATGGGSATEVNRIKQQGIRELLHAVWQSGYCQPPMRENWVIQTLAARHLGDRWNSDLYVPPAQPVKFSPLAEEERKRFWDSSPWNDLAAIRKAAGTQDTDEIIRMVAAAPTRPANTAEEREAENG